MNRILKNIKNLRKLVFLLGFLVALIVGIFGEFKGVGLLLLFLGLIVGFISIEKKDNVNFMIAVLTLLMVINVSNLIKIDDIIPKLGSYLQAIIINAAIFMSPAAVIVSIKEVYNLIFNKKQGVNK